MEESLSGFKRTIDEDCKQFIHKWKINFAAWRLLPLKIDNFWKCSLWGTI